MAGAWAGAVLAIAALSRLLYAGFLKAVKVAIREELGRVWKDQDEIEHRLTALETAMQFIRKEIEALRQMMQDHVDR
jgi:chaperonin cofactor prefoldin